LVIGAPIPQEGGKTMHYHNLLPVIVILTGLLGIAPPVHAVHHYSVFVVTPAGIIATDPINADAATWLKAEFKRRFGKPVRYLIYSHDHVDHSSGGEVFADTAVVIAHDNAKRTILGEKRPTAVPDVTFSERLVIEFGGTVVELSYVGRNHSDNSIVMRFPKERVLFGVDFLRVDSIGWKDFSDSYMEDWIESLRRVEVMDFDILAPGHGPVGTKDHVRTFRQYIEDLHGQVLAGARRGKTLDEIKAEVDPGTYKLWAGYDSRLMLNIEGMYRHVQLHRRGN
jgi:glyoxylase-like metal-dependent hydrolase (beta-lactamase superfamily II)